MKHYNNKGSFRSIYVHQYDLKNTLIQKKAIVKNFKNGNHNFIVREFIFGLPDPSHNIVPQHYHKEKIGNLLECSSEERLSFLEKYGLA